ncbi:acyl-CoA thioesterase [Dokdonia sp. Dokd-P16]|uniref:acyl-CoA thioesterase n=1 Tax=Dokdonia sp. Dokd-P16 TaxID=2173169 RepID=UPI000D544AC3|nr:acyl-CoA thioesterase [Dokdonia sp. Dokd-P16]AWH75009.1 acyl-CoA thioesterase [Dokdonia sp. Dokd-P16]
MITLEERIENSETRIFKAVFPNTTNHYDTLFGGTAMHMMDEAAFICATRFSRKKVVTISTSQIDFTKAIPQGTIVELIARIEKVGNTSCVVRVEIYKEDMYNYDRELAVAGTFTFVAINDEKKPIKIIDNA